MRHIAAVLILVSLVSACGTKVRFSSLPSGAKVYLDDTLLGETPVVFETREIYPRTYRVELNGDSDEGKLTPRICPGRVVGAIFTLGIVAMVRPVHCYDPDRVTSYFGITKGPPRLTPVDAKLYDLRTSEVATGTCNVEGYCSVSFPDGRTCGGNTVRGTKGAARGEGSSRSIAASAGGEAAAPPAASGASAEEPSKSTSGAAVLRCPDFLIDCSLSMDSEGTSGHGECTDPKGGQYRLLLLPF